MQSDKSDSDPRFQAADRALGWAAAAFYAAEPQGIGTAKPCECAQRAIDHGFLTLDPDCAANRCKEMRGHSGT